MAQLAVSAAVTIERIDITATERPDALRTALGAALPGLAKCIRPYRFAHDPERIVSAEEAGESWMNEFTVRQEPDGKITFTEREVASLDSGCSKEVLGRLVVPIRPGGNPLAGTVVLRVNITEQEAVAAMRTVLDSMQALCRAALGDGKKPTATRIRAAVKRAVATEPTLELSLYNDLLESADDVLTLFFVDGLAEFGVRSDCGVVGGTRR